eukprot:CAMPEP_0181051584 /NCGR_PEP_ID=MMETSP1070-20121207/17133_1 /TAXON_ID=265543 /ORGANISM="Minutocellus polymorphus, Strain NH13" /LENGTH=384 /DNA_ID=CAMNT_0023130617 /DNA_START=141 /DNA_END=1291 /DNA_ORIENTATION=+
MDTTSDIDSNVPSFAIGGGAINEKERTYPTSDAGDRAASGEQSSGFDPNSLPHALHALAGLDRYPNYLSRWSVDDMDRLEESLERQLQAVRRQKRSIRERRDGIDVLLNRAMKDDTDGTLTQILTPPTSWEEIRDHVLDPRASDAIFRSKQFKKKPPNIDDLLTGRIQVQLDGAQLEDLIDNEFYDVYSFPLLSNVFCKRVRTLVQKVVSLGEKEEFEHLNLGRRPVDLDTIGLGWINTLLFHLVIRPISQQLFAETEEFEDLDWRQGYIAGYSVNPSAPAATPRQRLVSHTDDSEVTLNIGLGEDFEGGALQFRGLRGTDEEGQLIGEFQPQLGTALLHAGRHLHEVTPVTSGNRYAFIIWARSWKSLRANTCPCCWLNRRQG